MDFLKQLGIDKNNYGGCTGPGGWSESKSEEKLDSLNPATDEVIASVYQASQNDNQGLVSLKQEPPAPRIERLSVLFLFEMTLDLTSPVLRVVVPAGAF